MNRQRLAAGYHAEYCSGFPLTLHFSWRLFNRPAFDRRRSNAFRDFLRLVRRNWGLSFCVMAHTGCAECGRTTTTPDSRRSRAQPSRHERLLWAELLPFEETSRPSLQAESGPTPIMIDNRHSQALDFGHDRPQWPMMRQAQLMGKGLSEWT